MGLAAVKAVAGRQERAVMSATASHALSTPAAVLAMVE
jgi:hypothetical protein